VLSSNEITDDVIKSLALGPRKDVRKWDHYYINDYNFNTYTYGKDKPTMNYGVSVKGTDEVEYYGILQEVIELTYLGSNRIYKTILFKCDWFDSINGLNVHEHYKHVDVNHTRKYPKYDPFVLAYQVAQVCFVSYPSMENDKNQWWAVLKMKPSSTMHAKTDDAPFQEENSDNPPTLSDGNIDEEIYVLDELGDELQEEEDVYVDGENEEDEDKDVDINIDEDMFEELLDDEDEI